MGWEEKGKGEKIREQRLTRGEKERADLKGYRGCGGGSGGVPCVMNHASTLPSPSVFPPLDRGTRALGVYRSAHPVFQINNVICTRPVPRFVHRAFRSASRSVWSHSSEPPFSRKGPGSGSRGTSSRRWRRQKRDKG